MDIEAVNRRIGELEACIGHAVKPESGEPLFVGVDLGTAYIVVVVVDAGGRPMGCALEFAQVVRDGLVVDYIGIVDARKKGVVAEGMRMHIKNGIGPQIALRRGQNARNKGL